MNKNSHRIIVNAARCQRMVVAESASGLGAGDAPQAHPAAGGAARTLGDLDIGKPNQLRHLALHPVTLSVALALTIGFVFVTTARAHILADPSDPGNQRPTVLQTANGVPQINIQTPSATGVSRNTYRQFDVQSKGAILNNSRTNTSTQLGEFVAANPCLATGEVSGILNEVSGGNLDVTTTGVLTNLRGRKQVVGIASIYPQGRTLDSTAGRITLQACLNLTTGDLVKAAHVDQAGLVGSICDLTIQAGATTNGAIVSANSNIWSAHTASSPASSFTNAGAFSGADVSRNTTSDAIDAAGASIKARGNLAITTTADLRNDSDLIANQRLISAAYGIVNTGTLEAAHHSSTPPTPSPTLHARASSRRIPSPSVRTR